MRKLIWKYDKQNKEWWTGESEPWANDGYTIKKNMKSYSLYQGNKFISVFNKFNSAKIVADLLENG